MTFRALGFRARAAEIMATACTLASADRFTADEIAQPPIAVAPLAPFVVTLSDELESDILPEVAADDDEAQS